MRLDGTSAIITGGTRGLGRTIAESFLAEGANVVCAARNPYDVKELLDLHPGRVHYQRTDVTDEDSVAELMEAAVAAFGRIDVLVNNAGVSRDGTISRLSTADWNTTVATNLNGVFLCTRAAIRPMQSQGGGRIINLSSCVASRAVAGAAAYSASKAAVEMFTRASALELAHKGITVNCLSPGYIDEGMGKQVAADDRIWESYRKRLLSGRLGRPEEVGAAAVFLAASDSSYVNGHVLEVNGGLQWAA
ncbi:SDR family NAD(P)-dependent oxidoreductase [Streptomyces sp. V2I9]|uniref:SDR family NAD(P)-dependent oxidoreductase n=1 Tax=Streptomyces sp. V2I9 TaxID=3042304 RepID=UPI00277D9E3D|nr:SDR family oxidoreductase [Streptomyces sp. V2I9]MDQ0986278.1 3-oxoacyl-[acyl-carrier protein] reductase [Streptomyces sp. V2I9]